VLASVPLPIRLTVQAWRLIQPYQSLIRFAAMLALMGAGGMSMMLIMGDGLRDAGTPAGTTTTASDRPAAIDTETAVGAETQSADLDRATDEAAAPDAAATSIAPTATGPAATDSRALMAIESLQTSVTPPYPTTPYPEPTLPQVADGSLPQVRTTEPAIATLKGTVLEAKSR
jgi:hypothetical protein